MDNKQDKQQNNNEQDKEVIQVEAKPVEEKIQTAPERVDNIKIDNLTLNIVPEQIKKRYEKHYKTNKMHLVTDIILVAIIIILLGVVLNLWLFSRAKLNNLVDFQVSSNPESLVNAQETEFTINYTNTTRSTLTDVNLVLRVPKALHQPDFHTEEYNTTTNTLVIGELAPKAHGQFKVSGFLLGNVNDHQEFLAVMNYKNKYGQTKQEFFNQKFDLTNSALQTEISLPGKVIATSPFNTKINLENTSAIDLSNIKIKMVWPKGYNFSESELGDPISNNLFAVPDLTTNQLASYAFTGKIYIENPHNPNFTTQIYTTYNDTEYLVAQSSNTTWADFSKFKISLTNTGNQSISPGETAKFTVLYKNEEDYEVTNIEIGLNLAGEFAATRQVRVGQTDYKKLEKVGPGEEGTIDLSAKTNSSINYTEYKEGGYVLETRAFAAYDDPNENARISVESKANLTQMNSRVSLKTLGLFYTSLGDQIGVGNVPPIVDEYTSYWVIIKTTNTNNPVKDLTITAKVPAGIIFTDVYNVTQGNQIVYNQETRTITWRLYDLDAFAGIFNPSPEARIQLAITPNLSQVGTSPLLLTDIKATATDTKTGAFVTGTGGSISTAIFSDDYMNKVIE